MQNGSLTIGDTLLNYGNGTNWTTNTSALLFECLDNTEIAIHDSGNKVVSFTQYQGGATPMFTIGRDMFWGTVPLTIANNLNVSGTTKLNAATTCISTLNISGNTQLNNCTNSGYYASNSSYAAPAIGINGGLGSKYVLYPGTGSTFPYALGINACMLWYSVPSAATHTFYISSNSYMSLSSTFLNVNNLMIVGATTMNSTLHFLGKL